MVCFVTCETYSDFSIQCIQLSVGPFDYTEWDIKVGLVWRKSWQLWLYVSLRSSLLIIVLRLLFLAVCSCCLDATYLLLYISNPYVLSYSASVYRDILKEFLFITSKRNISPCLLQERSIVVRCLSKFCIKKCWCYKMFRNINNAHYSYKIVNWFSNISSIKKLLLQALFTNLKCDVKEVMLTFIVKNQMERQT